MFYPTITATLPQLFFPTVVAVNKQTGELTVGVDTYKPLEGALFKKVCFFYFSTKTFVVGTQKNRREMVLLSTQKKC